MRSIIFAPLAWLLLLPLYFMKILPIVGRRYTLTNRRVMIQRGWAGTAAQQVALADINEVRITEDANSGFFRAATLEVLSKERVVLKLPGVPGPESFRQAILNACKAWVPGKAKEMAPPFIPASAGKSA